MPAFFGRESAILPSSTSSFESLLRPGTVKCKMDAAARPTRHQVVRMMTIE